MFAKITEARGEAVRAITKLKQRNNMIVGKGQFKGFVIVTFLD